MLEIKCQVGRLRLQLYDQKLHGAFLYQWKGRKTSMRQKLQTRCWVHPTTDQSIEFELLNGHWLVHASEPKKVVLCCISIWLMKKDETS